MGVELRALLESDDRTAFTCGQADLDRLFHHFAGQNQFKHHLCVTYVAAADGVILGFATVTAGSIERQHLPPVRKRPPAYPLPVLRLARLGVDVRAQKAGIGRALLQHVLLLALKQRDTIGCGGVLADAKPDAVAFYARYGFGSVQDLKEGALHGEPSVMFLSIETIATSGA